MLCIVSDNQLLTNWCINSHRYWYWKETTTSTAATSTTTTATTAATTTTNWASKGHAPIFCCQLFIAKVSIEHGHMIIFLKCSSSEKDENHYKIKNIFIQYIQSLCSNVFKSIVVLKFIKHIKFVFEFWDREKFDVWFFYY